VPKVVGLFTVALAVLGFTGGWPGKLALDGPGVSMFLRIAIDHLHHGGGVPYWLPEMWTGAPVWALAPSFPTLALAPLGILVGADTAVKVATLAAQVVGGWGAYFLASSLWRPARPGPAGPAGPAGDRTIPDGASLIPLAVAVLYALHPIFLSHGALFGHETSLWVMAITPWLAWSLRRALQRNQTDDGEAPRPRRYAVLAGLLAAVAVLQQAEHAYALALLCAFQLLIELGKARAAGCVPERRGGCVPERRGGCVPHAMRHVLGQACLVVIVALGAVAFWLAPFLVLSDSFILTPPETVRTVLEEGVGSFLGHEPGTFLSRAEPLVGTVTFSGDLLTGNVYLSWVCLAPTFLTAFLLGRHDDDGHLSAILVAGMIGVWLSTAGVPLADSGPAQRFELFPFLVVGGLTGLVVGSCLRRVTTGRATVVAGLVATVLMVSAPYVTPFLALQRVVPLLENIRFPRFYPVAALGLALGAAYPLRFLGPWARRHRRPSLAPVLTATGALVLVGAFLVDIHPYRSFYRVGPPADDAAYRQVAANLAAVGGDFRVATPLFGDARHVDSLQGAGVDLSVGWPHPLASKQAWRLTGEAVIAPPSYRESALGLAATAYMAVEQVVPDGPGRQRVEGVYLERNPAALPLVRAYDQAVVVRDEAIAAELAVSLAHRNVAVVTAGPDAAAVLGDMSVGELLPRDACDDRESGSGPLAGEVAMACALHNWIGVFAPFDAVPVTAGIGFDVRSPADGLAGISLWLDRPPAGTEVVLASPDGEEVARAASGLRDWDDNSMYAFRFPALDGSAGQRYRVSLSCPGCDVADVPRLFVSQGPRGEGNLVLDGEVHTDRAAAFSLVHEGFPVAETPSTALRATEMGPGHWRVGVAGDKPSLVVVAEAWFPGWTATVDGKPAPLVKADGAFLGVVVGPGDHQVELRYTEPAVATAGRAVTAATLAAIVVAGPLSGARRRRRRLRAESTRA